MANPEDTRLARQYLLGILSTESRDQVEQRFLFDAEFEETVILEETDLLDELVAGSLDPDEERAMRHWARTQDRARRRLELAGAFHHVSRSSTWAAANGEDAGRIRGARSLRLPAVRVPRFSTLSIAGLALACCALVFASLWLLSANRDLKARLQALQSPYAERSLVTADQRAPSPVASSPSKVTQTAASGQTLSASSDITTIGSVLTVLLVAEEGRGQSRVPEVLLQPRTQIVQLQLIAQSELPEGLYSASIIGPDGSLLPGLDHLQSQRAHQHNVVTLRLPSRSMKRGAYRVELAQLPNPDRLPALEFSFRVEKP